MIHSDDFKLWVQTITFKAEVAEVTFQLRGVGSNPLALTESVTFAPRYVSVDALVQEAADQLLARLAGLSQLRAHTFGPP